MVWRGNLRSAHTRTPRPTAFGAPERSIGRTGGISGKHEGGWFHTLEEVRTARSVPQPGRSFQPSPVIDAQPRDRPSRPLDGAVRARRLAGCAAGSTFAGSSR